MLFCFFAKSKRLSCYYVGIFYTICLNLEQSRSAICITSSTSSGRLTRSSNNSNSLGQKQHATPPARKAANVGATILGDEGLNTQLLLLYQCVVTSRYTGYVIFSSATSICVQLLLWLCIFTVIVDTVSHRYCYLVSAPFLTVLWF